MKTIGLRRWFWGVLAIIVVALLWLFYDMHLKYEINDYRASLIEEEIVDNYFKNQHRFSDLISFSKGLGNLERLQFEPDGYISFQLYDSAVDRSNVNYINNILIMEGSDYYVEDLSILHNNQVKTFFGGQTRTVENWMIEFRGEINHHTLPELLTYHKISLDDVKELKKMVEELDCSAISNYNDLLEIRYRGHLFENFSYKIPLSDTVSTGSWNPISNGVYWEYYRSEIYCGWTKW